jgi:hypothetical protein
MQPARPMLEHESQAEYARVQDEPEPIEEPPDAA